MDNRDDKDAFSKISGGMDKFVSASRKGRSVINLALAGGLGLFFVALLVSCLFGGGENPADQDNAFTSETRLYQDAASQFIGHEQYPAIKEEITALFAQRGVRYDEATAREYIGFLTEMRKKYGVAEIEIVRCVRESTGRGQDDLLRLKTLTRGCAVAMEIMNQKGSGIIGPAE